MQREPRGRGVVAVADVARGARSPTSTCRDDYAPHRRCSSHAAGDKKRLSLADARANGLKLDWAQHTPPVPAFLGTRVLDDYPPRQACAVYRLAAVLLDLGMNRAHIRRSSMTRQGAPRRQPVRGRAGHAGTRSSRVQAQRRAVIGFWPAQARDPRRRRRFPHTAPAGGDAKRRSMSYALSGREDRALIRGAQDRLLFGAFAVAAGSRTHLHR